MEQHPNLDDEIQNIDTDIQKLSEEWQNSEQYKNIETKIMEYSKASRNEKEKKQEQIQIIITEYKNYKSILYLLGIFLVYSPSFPPSETPQIVSAYKIYLIILNLYII